MIDMLMIVPRVLWRGLEVVPLVCHVRRVQEARSHSLRLLDALCVAGHSHFFIQDKDLLNSSAALTLGDLLTFGLRSPLTTLHLLRAICSFFLVALRVSLILGAALIIEAVLEAIYLVFDLGRSRLLVILQVAMRGRLRGVRSHRMNLGLLLRESGD